MVVIIIMIIIIIITVIQQTQGEDKQKKSEWTALLSILSTYFILTGTLNSRVVAKLKTMAFGW